MEEEDWEVQGEIRRRRQAWPGVGEVGGEAMRRHPRAVMVLFRVPVAEADKTGRGLQAELGEEEERAGKQAAAWRGD